MAERRKRRVGLIHPRLAMTIALLPISVGLMAAWGGVTANTIESEFPSLFFGVMFSIPALVFFWGSVLIWWPTIHWTPQRRSVVVCVTAALVLGLVISSAWVGEAHGPESITLLCLVAGVGSGVAMGFTHARLWTEPQALEAGPIPCPECGANLRGQRACRCKACGKLFTLGELAAARSVAVALGLPAAGAEEETVAVDELEQSVDASR